MRATVILMFGGLLAMPAGAAEQSIEREVLKRIDLPAPDEKGTVSVERALAERRSRRSYGDRALTKAEVSQLLWAAYGVTEPVAEPARLRGGLRTAPSAGARYPLEIYLVAGEVDGLAAGVYRYDSAGHRLELLAKGDRRVKLMRACLDQRMVGLAPVDLVWSAVYERTTSKYGDRGRERYVCMDLGHSAQNVYLQAEALGLGTCAVGAFDDAALAKAIGLAEPEQPLYVMPVGAASE